MCLIHVRHVNGVCIVSLTGRFTSKDGVKLLRDTLDEMLSAGERHFLLDLGRLIHLDKGGLRALVGGFATVTNRGGQLKLLHVTDRIRHLLLTNKLLTIFESFEDESAAFGSFGPSQREMAPKGAPDWRGYT